MPTERLPLIVRLRNWVGDVTLGVPMLQRLSDAGYALELIGKGWARDLLAGHGWPVHTMPARARERIAQLRTLRRACRARDPGFEGRLNALCLPYSFSSALEFRLAGLRALGHANEGRSFLLAQALPRHEDRHELLVYWAVGDALLGQAAEPPPRIGLKLAPEHRRQAEALIDRHGLGSGFVVVCPFAGGTWSGQDKTWPDFPRFVAEVLPSFGQRIVVCPGPGEEAVAHERFASALCLEGVKLGTYAALLARAALMVSNDTGPGHLAAAVGTPLVSVLGPSDPARWRAWGPGVRLVQGDGSWPSIPRVGEAVSEALHPPSGDPPRSAPLGE